MKGTPSKRCRLYVCPKLILIRDSICVSLLICVLPELGASSTVRNGPQLVYQVWLVHSLLTSPQPSLQHHRRQSQSWEEKLIQFVYPRYHALETLLSTVVVYSMDNFLSRQNSGADGKDLEDWNGEFVEIVKVGIVYRSCV